MRRAHPVRVVPIALAGVSVWVLGACGAPSAIGASSPSTTAPAPAPAPEVTSTRAPRPTVTTSTTDTPDATDAPETPGTPDTNESPRSSCRTVDLGGLTVSVDCDAPVPDPESGVTLTKDSVYGLPGESFEELADVDATNRVVATADGKPVVIYLLGSDTLFDVGSSTVKSTAEAALPTVIASINKRAPDAKILVRGFTDSSGAAAANQTLSEQRATSMVAWLASGGLPRARMEASGFGSTKPAAQEDTELGTALNRRIEIVAVG